MAYKVLINDGMDREGLDIFDREGIVYSKDYREGASLLETIGEFDAFLVRSKTKVTKDIIEAGSKGSLRMIGRGGVGVDNIDVEAANQYGIVVKFAPNGVTNSTAEQAIALMFAVARKIPQAHLTLKNGIWQKKPFEGTELQGKTLGIIGCGRIGQSVAEKARALGMNVLGYDADTSRVKENFPDSKIQYVSKDELLAASDVVSLHSGGKELIIAGGALERMKIGSILINASRGNNVDESDLYEALASKHLYGAGLDTYASEPKKEGQEVTPSMKKLAGLENVVLTSHLGASTREGQRRTSIELARVTADYLLRGDYSNSVNTTRPSEEDTPGYCVCVHNADVPGVFAQISQIFAEHKINIRATPSEKVKGAGQAITNYLVGRPVNADVLEKLRSIEGVHRVLYSNPK